MGTHDDSPGRVGADAAGAEEEDDDAGAPRIGSRHGQLAESGVSTGPVST
jgi:hypothetical protein